jgi:hypothetical protein
MEQKETKGSKGIGVGPGLDVEANADSSLTLYIHKDSPGNAK